MGSVSSRRRIGRKPHHRPASPANNTHHAAPGSPPYSPMRGPMMCNPSKRLSSVKRASTAVACPRTAQARHFISAVREPCREAVVENRHLQTSGGAHPHMADTQTVPTSTPVFVRPAAAPYSAVQCQNLKATTPQRAPLQEAVSWV